MTNPHPHGCFWTKFAHHYGAPDIKYCEETLCGLISEPANTWSNFGFILVGLIVLLNGLKKDHPLGKIMGSSTILVGVLSFTYHMSNNYVSQFFDFIGMHCFFGLILCLNFVRLKLLSQENLSKVYLISYLPFILCVALFRYLAIPIQVVMAAVILAIFTSELFVRIKYKSIPNKWYFISLLFFALAFACQVIDVRRIYCDPTNHMFQPHAFWHYFNAVGMGLLYRFYSTTKH